MGYELNRFLGEIDDEFQCSICTMVLEDPVQTPCEHSFCNNCIKDWLSINQTCPSDRKRLTISDLKPVNRLFRNLWYKLDIKCDFESQGCSASSKLENLAVHVSSCKYNPNTEIVCDKGCNMTITRQEYHINNCFSHLVNRVSAQENEIIKLRHELNDQKEDFEKIVSQQQIENRQLNDEIRGQREENRKLKDELSRQRHPQQLENAMNELSDTSVISSRPLKWNICYNVIIDRPNILKVAHPMREGYFKSYYPLEPAKANFQVHVLSISEDDHNFIALESLLRYDALGTIHSLGDRFSNGQKWKVGDIIECGVTFPNDFNNTKMYVSINKKIFINQSITISKDSIYPKINLSTRLDYNIFNNFLFE